MPSIFRPKARGWWSCCCLAMLGIAVPAILLLRNSRDVLALPHLKGLFTASRGSMAPLKCRDDLASRAVALGLTGNAAEIGVRDGMFAKTNLLEWTGRMYYMIDAWSHRPEDVEVGLRDTTKDDMNELQESPHLARMNQARQNTEQWSSRREMIRGFSTVVCHQFKDNYFDWVYLDALHTYEAVKRDLEAWYPLVKPGGLISGDDFTDHTDKPMLEWNGPVPAGESTALSPLPLIFSYKSERSLCGAVYSWGTRSAVTDFFRKIGVAIHVTFTYDCYMFPAWYALKPLGEPEPHSRRLSQTKMHPVKCREDLPALARELGVAARSAQVGDAMTWQHGRLEPSAPLIDTTLSAAAPTDAHVDIDGEHLWSWLHITSQLDHTRSGVKAQLEYWWPRLQKGGLMSGDDFVNGQDSRWSETITTPPSHLFLSAGWRKTAVARHSVPVHWDVERAVNEFFGPLGVEVFVSYAHYCYPYPSWYVIKP
eukprot:COSAG02_NODE_4205_length_5628_cov_3.597938_1_plen_481_part_00